MNKSTSLVPTAGDTLKILTKPDSTAGTASMSLCSSNFLFDFLRTPDQGSSLSLESVHVDLREIQDKLYSAFPAVQLNTSSSLRLRDDTQTSDSGTQATRSLFHLGRMQAKKSPAIDVVAEWDGYVEAIYEDYFTARMRGLRGGGVAGKDEEAEIPTSDVDDADRDLLTPGGFFRLTIAYESPGVGPKRRYTSVQFRRLPAFTKRELDEAEKLADRLINGFQLESVKSASGG